MTYAAQLSEMIRGIPHAANQAEFDAERERMGNRTLALISDLEEHGYLLGGGFVATNTPLWLLGSPEIMIRTLNSGLTLLERNLATTHDPLHLALTHIQCANLYRNPLGPLGLPISLYIEEQAKYTYHRRAAADVMVRGFDESPNKFSFLVTGFNVRTDLAGKWDTDFVDYEVEEGHTQYSDEGVLVTVPSAFHVLIGISDYERALEIAESTPEAFVHPGICGWREVCRAFVNVGDRSEYYLKAAKFFASDVHPGPHLPGNKPYWSGFNSQTLAPYFRARAALAKPKIDPDGTIQAIRQAAGEIQPHSSGFVYPPSRTLAILVHGLGSFLETKDVSVLDKLAQDYKKEKRFWNYYAEDDEILLRGLSLIGQAIEGFRYDPVEELRSGRLSDGIDILESIPESSQFQFVSQIGRTFSETALEISQGTTYGEVASILQRIVREDDLQHLMIKLLSAIGPYHAKVTCGPIEYGKDIIAVIDDKGIPTLHLYALKVGDIDASKWRAAKEAIDQMFTVPVDNPLVKQYAPAKTCGFLVFNGHFNQHIDPVATAWFAELRSSKGWNLTVLDLDGLSKWIVTQRLFRVLEEFSRELCSR